MKSTKAEVTDFLDKCSQLKKSKFILAPTRIKDVLRSIVNSPALYELFYVVTANYDYLTAKRKCMITQHEGFLNRSRLVLPDTVGDRLAFIFCLLVEFDHDSINFNEFLQQFFAEDGSYYSSFHKFCDKVIVSLENLIADIFADELKEEEPRKADEVREEQAESAAPAEAVAPQPDSRPPVQDAPAEQAPADSAPPQPAPQPATQPAAAQPDPAAAEKFSAVSILISREKNIISCSDMSEADKQDGISILNELESAFREDRYRTVDAVLRGYEYYSDCHGGFSQLISLLTTAMED